MHPYIRPTIQELEFRKSSENAKNDSINIQAWHDTCDNLGLRVIAFVNIYLHDGSLGESRMQL